MTPSPRAPRRAAPALVLPLLACLGPQGDPPPAPPAPAADELPLREQPRPADAAALFALFAASPGVEARFEESKHLALLAVPLESSGRFYFLPPGHLTRVVEAPEPSVVRVTPTELVTESRGAGGAPAVERLDLARDADLRAFVGSLSSVLAGRRDALAARWAVEYALVPDSNRWTLRVAPRDDVEGHERLAALVDALVLHGEGRAVQRFVVHEGNGDRTETRILEADPRREFDAEERAALFGIEPAPPGGAAGEADAPR